MQPFMKFNNFLFKPQEVKYLTKYDEANYNRKLFILAIGQNFFDEIVKIS